MRLIQSPYLLFIILLTLGCATAKKPTTTTSTGTRYSEDLSVWRPKADPVPVDNATKPADNGDSRKPTTTTPEARATVNKRLDSVLDSIDRINVQRSYVDGFTIQVYSGMKREDALKAKKELTSSLPELTSEVQYAQPNFRVKVGKYYSRIDAQKDFLDVRKLFPTAIIIPDKVAIN